MPEYVAFTERPVWGIGQVQTAGGSIFGQSHWLALSRRAAGRPRAFARENTGAAVEN